MNLEKIQNSWPLASIFFVVGFAVGYKFKPLLMKGSFLTWKYKLVMIVPRAHLRSMTNSQLASYCSSISILAYRTSRDQTPLAHFIWMLTGQPKVVLQTNSIHDLKIFAQNASKLSICSNLVEQTSDGVSILAIGPGPNSIIDQITGHLKLC